MPFSIFKDYGILGLNARGLDYIKPFNSRLAVKMADSKLKVKHFLSTRGIPVPRLHGTIRSSKELANFNFDILPDSFVLKPDAGFGGEGILVISGKTKEGWETISGREVSQAELLEHIQDILDGRFSIASLPDTAFFEQRVHSAELIPGLPVQGLPDIRVIVHNLVPVMAMLRVPTPESEGKANLHLGGYGFGVNLATGKTTHLFSRGLLFNELPNGAPSNGHQIPHWEQILQIASEAQLHTNLGYLAADIVLDEREGPVLIEINARAGLSVQIANLAPLKTRLERVKGLKVDSPAMGVRLARDLFGSGQKKTKAVDKKTVIGFIEPAEIIVADTTTRVRAECDPTHVTTAIDRSLAAKLELPPVAGSTSLVQLKLRIGGRRITAVAELTDLDEADYKVILGRRDLSGFLIDPDSREAIILPKIDTVSVIKQFDYAALDREICRLDRQIKLLAYLKPTNLATEEKRFFAAKGRYDPQFQYPKLKCNPDLIRSDLAKLNFPDTPLGQIFREKKSEIEKKLALLQAIGASDFAECSIVLYGQPNSATLASARALLRSRPAGFMSERPTLDIAAAQHEFYQAFKSYGLKKWKVVLKSDLAADAIAGKQNTLFLRAGAVFAPQRLRGLIAHEVATHILRAENGQGQPYQIFARGLAGYLETEEGLAIYNQELVLPAQNEKRYWPAISTLAVDFAAQHSFVEVYQFALKHGCDAARAWQVALKLKRGLSDTSQAGVFTKEHLYYTGYLAVRKWVESGGELARLYVGKVKLTDLPIISQLPEIRPARILPNFW